MAENRTCWKFFSRYVIAVEAIIITEDDMHQWMNTRYGNIWHLKKVPWLSMEGMAGGSNYDRYTKINFQGNCVIIQTTCFCFENLWDTELF